jgi:hypothetical protein
VTINSYRSVRNSASSFGDMFSRPTSVAEKRTPSANTRSRLPTAVEKVTTSTQTTLPFKPHINLDLDLADIAEFPEFNLDSPSATNAVLNEILRKHELDLKKNSKSPVAKRSKTSLGFTHNPPSMSPDITRKFNYTPTTIPASATKLVIKHIGTAKLGLR